MRPTKPYLFDRCFEVETVASSDATGAAGGAAERQTSKPKRVYNEKDLENARAEARQQAFLEFENTEHKRLAEVCNSIAVSLKNADDSFCETKKELTDQCILLALALMKKLTLDFGSNNKVSEIENFILQIAPHIFDKAQIIVKVSEDIAPQVQQKLVSLADISGVSARLNVVADRKVVGNDCVIEWPGGGASRNQHDTWQRLSALIEKMTGQSMNELDTQQMPVPLENCASTRKSST